MRRTQFVVVAACVVFAATIGAGQGTGGNQMSADAFKGIELRGLGPTLSTGRVADVDVDPNNPTRYFVASAVGGLWKSDNRGNTWHSVFDNGGSFNMCCVVVDPKNSNIVWLGTGENSVPRSATYGDGVYKSTDGGETWTRVGLEKSEHIGNIKIDPRNSDVVYVAAQGPLWSAGGDRGVYKTTDGGKTWKAILTVSADTGANEVAIDPNNPDVLYASVWQRRRAVGQMIGGGPESGLFKSTNGGGTWTKLTNGLPKGDVGRMALGVDPKAKPTRVYALLNGLTGESGFYRSDDAGASFERMGAPYGKPGASESTASPCDNPAGRRGGGGGAPAVAPTGAAAPPPAGNAAAATPPAGAGRGRGPAQPPAGAPAGQAGAAGAGAAGAAGAPPAGAPRGGGRGGCAVGAYCGGDPGYYQEIYVDPIRPDTIWSANTNLEWSRDGGRCWSPVPNMGSVHVDFHDVWADPKDRLHIIVANDGGAYESWDEGKTWRHFDNLPVTQFYRVAVDDALPFYNVCGGAQDNESQCGPSRTINRVGVRLSDWWMIGGCDGFTSRIEPGNPNIVYTSCQSGGVSRLDLRTGVNKSIHPGQGGIILPNADYPAPPAPPDAAGGAGAQGGGGGRGGGRGGAGVAAERTNWDAPYIVSPFSPTRIYWASSKVYRSDDRGDHWIPISPDLTRALDPHVIPIMGKVWDPLETVAYNNATTPLSDIVTIDESPLMEGLIYVGSDDGLVQVTEDGGKTWRKTDKFADFPQGIYVTNVRASVRDSNVVFATLNNWQRGDFKPYIVRSDDRGKTWKSINGDFPADRMDAWAIVQDHEDGNLLFVGAEFGLFFTVDGGTHWVQLKGGLPTIQVRDLAIQKRENDLVLGTFGRGFYVLDDYSALREVTPEAMTSEAALFPLRHVYAFDELGYPQAAWGNYTTPNPPNGAVFTYHVSPGFSAKLVLTIADEAGRDLCRMDVPDTAGMHRVDWNLRVTQPGQGGGRGGGGGGGGGGGRGGGGNTIACAPVGAAANAAPAPAPVGPGGGGGGFGRGATAPMVASGRYQATLGKLDGDKVTAIGKAQAFQVTPLPAKNW